MEHNNIKITKKNSKTDYVDEYLFEYSDGNIRKLIIEFENKDKEKIIRVINTYKDNSVFYRFHDNYYSIRRWIKSDITGYQFSETVYYYKNGTKEIEIKVEPEANKLVNSVTIEHKYSLDDIITENKIVVAPKMFGKQYENTTTINMKTGIIKTNKEVKDDDTWSTIINTVAGYVSSNENVLKAFTRIDYRFFKTFLDGIMLTMDFQRYDGEINKHSVVRYFTKYNSYELKEMFFQILKKVKPDYSDDKYKNRYFPANIKEAISLYEKGIIGETEYNAFLIEKELGIDRIEKMLKEGSLKMWIHREYEDLSEDMMVSVFYKLLESIITNREIRHKNFISDHNYHLDNFEKTMLSEVCGIDRFY